MNVGTQHHPYCTITSHPPHQCQNAVLMLRRTSKIKKIAYLACDLKSASKNLVDLARPASKTLSGAPFVPVAVTPVDMFPLTDHFEVIIYLERLVETQS
ncbi:tRNA methyltransferase 2 [Homalodisca vitripennis]|nr:tRNA methyltransferase 2 [Homalodisca vitripennis]